MRTFLLFLVTLMLTYFNGANDNFKGTATLWGSGTLNYKQALLLAMISTFAGSICAYFFAAGLIQRFSGAGWVPLQIARSVHYVFAVAAGAGLTIWLATRLRFPVSTTHGLVGGMIGAGLTAAVGEISFSMLGSTFLLPLLVSPVAAVVLAGISYLLLTRVRKASGITKESCACIGNKQMAVPITGKEQQMVAATPIPALTAKIDAVHRCAQQYQGAFLGLRFQPCSITCTMAALPLSVLPGG